MNESRNKWIQTVRGAVSAASLAVCQSHEHLAIRRGKSAECNPALCIDEPTRTLLDLIAFRDAGGTTIVDAQPVGCGRDAEVLQDLSEKSGVQIIASTGFHRLAFYPEDHWIFRWDQARLRELFVQELCEGMYLDGDNNDPEQVSEIRAGQIKTALDAEAPRERLEILFAAAAEAALETGAPLMVHTDPGTDAPALAERLFAMGLPYERMIFCHMDRTCGDLSANKKIASLGAYLEYDTIGRFKYHSDEREIEIFREMIEAGFADRLLFSLDVTRERLRGYCEEAIGLDYLLSVFLPALRAAGIAEEELQKIYRDNCREVFAVRE